MGAGGGSIVAGTDFVEEFSFIPKNCNLGALLPRGYKSLVAGTPARSMTISAP
jgi:hypothetical protein